MKNNKINVIVALCLICVLSLALATQTVAMAAVTKNQSKFHTINSVGTTSLLSATADDADYNVENYATRYDESPSLNTSGSGLELKVSAPNAAKGLCWYNVNYFVYADFADNIATAIKNGAISVQSSVFLKSGKEGKNDTLDEAYARFALGTRGDFDYSTNISGNNEGKDGGFSAVVTKDSVTNNGAKTDSYLEYSVSIGADELAGKDVSSFMLHGFSHFVFAMWVQYNTLYMKEPVLTLTTNDHDAPTIDNVLVRDNVDGSKIVTFTVTDELSGVQNVSCGNALSGGKKEVSDDTRTAVYEYVVADAEAVTVTMTDNVGNVATTDVKLGKVSVDKLFVDKNITFAASLPDGNYRFTTDGTTPDETSAVATNGANPTTVSGKGDYTLRVRGTADNANYTTEYVAEFRVDDTDYKVDVAAVHCIVNGAQTARYGEKVTLTVLPDSGYELYKITVDGNEVKSTDSLTLTVTADTSVEIVCRLVISKLVPVQTEFVYDGNEVVLDFGDTDVSDITFDFGNGATCAKAAGAYNVSWSVDNDRAVGSGSFELFVEAKVVTVSDVVKSYVYKQFDFSYTLSEQNDCISISFRNALNIECSPKLPGKYNYKFVSSDDSVVIEGDFEGEIQIQKIKITVDVITEAFKQFDEVARQLEVRLKEQIDELVDKINVSLYCNDSKVDEVYNAGEYRYEINLTDGADDLYEVVGSEGSFVVQPKTLHLRPLKNQYRYVGEESTDILFEVVEDLPDGIEVSGSLTYLGGNNAGEYPIVLGDVALTAENAEDNQNYTLALCDEEVLYTVLSRKIVVKTSSVGSVYGDEDAPVAATLLYGQLSDGDVLVAVREQGSDAGSYAINTVKVVDVNGNDVSDNYSVVVIAGNYNIAKRTVEVIADGFEKVYGEDDGEITYTASGLVDGDVLQGSLAREVGEKVGLYKVVVGTLSNDNYDIRIARAYCTITPKTVVVTAENIVKVYGDADPQIVALCDDVDVETLGLRFKREVGENVGNYNITLAEVANTDYNVVFSGAILTINPAEAVVELKDAQKVYGEEDPEFDFIVDGIDVDELNLVVARNQGEDVGSYEIFATCNENYKLSVNKATLTIVKANLQIVAEEQTVVYNGGEQHYLAEGATATYRDANGNEVSAPVDAGEYEVQLSFDGDDNHNGTVVRTKLVVKPKMITVIVDATPVRYNGQSVLPVFTLSQDVNAMVVFDNGITPDGAGKYGYTIMFESQNYYCNFHGTLVVE